MINNNNKSIYEFCTECNEIINVKTDFHKSFYENLFLYQIVNKQNDYLLFEEIDAELFVEIYNNKMLRDFTNTLKCKKICGKCIEELRPYIKYINDDMYIFLPYNSTVIYNDSDESDHSSESDTY
jgi:hypothetical protein